VKRNYVAKYKKRYWSEIRARLIFKNIFFVNILCDVTWYSVFVYFVNKHFISQLYIGSKISIHIIWYCRLGYNILQVVVCCNLICTYYDGLKPRSQSCRMRVGAAQLYNGFYRAVYRGYQYLCSETAADHSVFLHAVCLGAWFSLGLREVTGSLSVFSTRYSKPVFPSTVFPSTVNYIGKLCSVVDTLTRYSSDCQ